MNRKAGLRGGRPRPGRSGRATSPGLKMLNMAVVERHHLSFVVHSAQVQLSLWTNVVHFSPISQKQ